MLQFFLFIFLHMNSMLKPDKNLTINEAWHFSVEVKGIFVYANIQCKTNLLYSDTIKLTFRSNTPLKWKHKNYEQLGRIIFETTKYLCCYKTMKSFSLQKTDTEDDHYAELHVQRLQTLHCSPGKVRVTLIHGSCRLDQGLSCRLKEMP